MKEGGLFARLFGRKKKEEKAPAEAPAASAAPEAPEEPAEAPAEAPAVQQAEAPAAPAEAPAEVPAAPAEVPAEVPAEAPAGRAPLVAVQYNRSYLAKLMQASDITKQYYAELKGELLAYGVHSRISWKRETFRYKRKLLVKATVRRKTLCLYFALPPQQYLGTKYKVEAVDGVRSHAETPCMYRIVNDRRRKYAAVLIAEVMAKNGVERKGEAVPCERPAYASTRTLLARGLIREVARREGAAWPAAAVPAMESVRAAEVDEVLEDEAAVALVGQSLRYADKTKTGIINVDTLGEAFEDGETVTLAEIRKRIPGYNKVTYIKVLARGVLSKALTVEADEFSIEAVKMIVLTGGKVLRTLRNN